MLIQLMGSQVYGQTEADKLYLEYDGAFYKYNSRIVSLNIDGQPVKTGDMPAVILDKRTLVPAREVFESAAIGAKVEWNGSKQEIYIAYLDKFITLKINSTTAIVNGKAVTLDVPAKLIRDTTRDAAKTMIPLRFVSEELGFEVSWDAITFTAALASGPYLKQLQTSKPDAQKPDVEQKPQEGINDKPEQSEKLDELASEKAKRTLPTVLKSNPISWIAELTEPIDPSSQQKALELTKEEHPIVTIDGVSYADNGSHKTFTINATGSISSVSYGRWGSSFFVDIEQAINGLNKTIEFNGNTIATSVRSSQFKDEPKVTRVVFDLTADASDLKVLMAPDRKSLIVALLSDADTLVIDNGDNSMIKQIDLNQNELGDYIEVTGGRVADVKVFRLTSPDRIVFDIGNTTSALSYRQATNIAGQYVTAIRTAQFDETTTRIVVETDGQADYTIKASPGNKILLQLQEPTYGNIVYDNIEIPTITLETQNATEKPIVLDNIIYHNNYMERSYTIILPGDYTNRFGTGDIKVMDGLIESMNIKKNSDGNTELTIHASRIYEYRIVQENGEIKIKAYRPKELFKQIVVVDAGHGGRDPGAVVEKTLFEKDLNLKIALYLKAMFDQDDSIKVYYTRTTDVYPSLQERCDIANEVEADFFLSIHNNAFNASEQGTETLHYSTRLTPKLDNVELATIFQQEIVAATGMRDRGTKVRDNLFVLKNTNMPAIIVEIGFMTNGYDLVKLKQDSFLKTAAESLYKATIRTFREHPTGR